MKQQVRSRVRRVAARVAPGVMDAPHQVAGLLGRTGALETRANRQAKRLTELEAEVQELRRLHIRVAELTDIVEELLVPATQRDEERLSALLNNYHDSSGTD